MRLMILKLHEALPWSDLPMDAQPHGRVEAARRYRAVVVTTLRQLKGLERTRIRIAVEPADAGEAVRFWLLPRLADRWQADGGVFRTDGWEIEFGGSEGNFMIEAHGDILCPFLSARWVHTAMLGLEHGCHRVAAAAEDGGAVFHAAAVTANRIPETRPLPPLPVIRNDPQWQAALDSPLGPALKRAWEQEAT
jgi:hypothetical protein